MYWIKKVMFVHFFQGFEYLLFGSQNDGHFRRHAKGLLNKIVTMWYSISKLNYDFISGTYLHFENVWIPYSAKTAHAQYFADSSLLPCAAAT